MKGGAKMAFSEENLEYSFADVKGIDNPICEGDHRDVKSLGYDCKRLKWEGNFNGLKNYIKESLGLEGKWTSPDGNAKKFKATNKAITITWYSRKQYTLIFQGKDGDDLKCELINKIETELAAESTHESLLTSSEILKNSALSTATAADPVAFNQSPSVLLVEPKKSKVIIEATNISTILDEDNGRNQSPLTPPINNVNGACSINRSLVADIEGFKLELVILQ